MQKFSEFIKEHNSVLENQSKALKVEEFNTLYEAKLKEMGAKSIMDLDEDQLETFNQYVKEIKAGLSKNDAPPAKESKTGKVVEKEVTDEKSFREYAETVLRKAHGDDYDEEIAKKVMDGIVDKVEGDDWGAAVGRLTSGLGS